MSDEPAHPRVILSDRQSSPVDTGGLVALAAEVLRAEGAPDAELSVSLVDEEEMAGLHQRYLGEPGSTDVLSFPMDDEGRPGEPRLLGDVVVCPEVAARQNNDAAAEVRLLLVHGILHLLGYDHEREQDRAAMWALQERYSGVAV